MSVLVVEDSFSLSADQAVEVMTTVIKIVMKKCREIFHMEDMTLGGIKGMVDHLSDKTGKEEF